jgi:hypothetical protein
VGSNTHFDWERNVLNLDQIWDTKEKGGRDKKKKIVDIATT